MKKIKETISCPAYLAANIQSLLNGRTMANSGINFKFLNKEKTKIQITRPDDDSVDKTLCHQLVSVFLDFEEKPPKKLYKRYYEYHIALTSKAA